MRYCMFCGMRMEDDDMFCTRCGKSVVNDEAEASPQMDEETDILINERTLTGTSRIPGAGMAAGSGMPAGSGTPRSTPPGNPAGGSGMRPRGDYRRGAGSNSMYGDPRVDTAREKREKSKGGKPDTSRYIMISAAAILVVVLGALLFMLVSPGTKEEDDNEKNTVAVYDDNSESENNMNQGQQTPASGQAADESVQNGAQETSAGQNTDSAGQTVPSDSSSDSVYSSGQQTDSSAASAQNTDSSAVSAQNGDSSAASAHNGDSSAASAHNSDSSAAQEQQEEEQEEDEPETDEQGTDYKDNDDNEEGTWEVDEDGNEVYYPGENEEYTDNDQTEIGGDGRKSDSGSVNTQSNSGRNVTDDDSYILPESDSRYYTREELNRLDDYNLQMAINEIYARHGRKFDTESIRKYFEGKSWYHGTIAPADFDGNESRYFNAYETANRELMIQIRDSRNSNIQW